MPSALTDPKRREEERRENEGGFTLLVQAVGEKLRAKAALRHYSKRLHVLQEMDRMPELNGLEVAAQAAKEWPRVRVLILSMHANEECVRQALHPGAAGYLVKDAAVSELEVGVRAVARGETYLSPAVSRHAVAGYLHPVPGPHSDLELLTLRQREILQLVAEGHSTKHIARTLQISAKTVENHRTQLMERLDIHESAGLTRFTIRVGLVSPDG